MEKVIGAQLVRDDKKTATLKDDHEKKKQKKFICKLADHTKRGNKRQQKFKIRYQKIKKNSFEEYFPFIDETQF